MFDLWFVCLIRPIDSLSFILLKDEGCEIDWCRLCSSRNRRSGGRLGFSLRRRRSSFSPLLCYRWTKVAISWRVYMHRQANVRVVDDASLSSSTVWLYGPDGPLMVLSLPFVWVLCLYYVGLCSFGHWPINKLSEEKKNRSLSTYILNPVSIELVNGKSKCLTKHVVYGFMVQCGWIRTRRVQNKFHMFVFIFKQYYSCFWFVRTWYCITENSC